MKIASDSILYRNNQDGVEKAIEDAATPEILGVGPAPSPVSPEMTAGGGCPTLTAGGGCPTLTAGGGCPTLTAGGGCPTPTAAPKARQAPSDFRRHLPHFEGRGNPLFVTFTTKDRQHLPEAARELVLKHILHDHQVKISLICAVVMPDHAHLLYWPMTDADGSRYSKTEIAGSIKSASAHSINKLLGRKGAVWQDESFDHVTRKSESIEAKAQYIVENPVRKGLCSVPDEYPFLWRDWVEGVGPPPSPVSVGPPPSPVSVGPAPSPVSVGPAPSPVSVGPAPSPVSSSVGQPPPAVISRKTGEGAGPTPAGPTPDGPTADGVKPDPCPWSRQP